MIYLYYIICSFFFFKQKTAYEMRISDWSSDVCSSDLSACHIFHTQQDAHTYTNIPPAFWSSPGPCPLFSLVQYRESKFATVDGQANEKRSADRKSVV